MFVNPPFIACPYCGKDTYGISVIGDNEYYRRCSDCQRPYGWEQVDGYPLPSLKKKVIYLDQFVISNILKAFNHELSKNLPNETVGLWKHFFSTISCLSKGQFIVCPHSEAHVDESLMVPYFGMLKKLYEHISHGTSFLPYHLIRHNQIYQLAEQWINQQTSYKLDLRVSGIINGSINAWQDKYYFSFPKDYLQETLEAKRRGRKRVASDLKHIFERWQSQKDRSFDDWFKEEAMSYGPTVWNIFVEYLKKCSYLHGKGMTKELAKLEEPMATDIVLSARLAFERKGLSQDHSLSMADAFFQSDALMRVPFNEISALMWAALARKAATGQKRPPNQGMNKDVETISILLPYCDAMFIDNECYSLLNEQPIKGKLNWNARLFCLNNISEFEQYTTMIMDNASPEHLKALKEVYGDNWQTPSTHIFN